MAENVSREAVTSWVEAYRNAWESNEPGEIRALFAEDAEYFRAPWGEPWRGRFGADDRAESFTEWWMKPKE